MWAGIQLIYSVKKQTAIVWSEPAVKKKLPILCFNNNARSTLSTKNIFPIPLNLLFMICQVFLLFQSLAQNRAQGFLEALHRTLELGNVGNIKTFLEHSKFFYWANLSTTRVSTSNRSSTSAPSSFTSLFKEYALALFPDRNSSDLKSNVCLHGGLGWHECFSFPFHNFNLCGIFMYTQL